jgi:AcrR family transcriptional regulator
MEVFMPRTKAAFQQIRDVSKQHILDKAAEVFADRGLANTKINDLAEAAGISQGLLYRYFADKEDVFVALLIKAIDDVLLHAQSAVKRTGTPLDKIRWLTEQILRGMSENPVYFRLFSQAMALPGRVYETLWKLETVVAILRELIVAGQTNGEVAKRDPDQLLLLYISSIFGLAAAKGLNIGWLDEHFPDAAVVLQVLKA